MNTPYLDQAYNSPATKCCGVGGCSAAFTHQVKTPHQRRKLHPVEPAVAKALVATLFQAPELQHACLPSPWIHPKLNLAYAADSHVLLQEPKRLPHTATEPVSICTKAYNLPGVTTHSFKNKNALKPALELLKAGVGFTFEPTPECPQLHEQPGDVVGGDEGSPPVSPPPPSLVPEPRANSISPPPAPLHPPSITLPSLQAALHTSTQPLPFDPLGVHETSSQAMEESLPDHADNLRLDSGSELQEALRATPPPTLSTSLPVVNTSTWHGETMGLTEYIFWVSYCAHNLVRPILARFGGERVPCLVTQQWKCRHSGCELPKHKPSNLHVRCGASGVMQTCHWQLHM